MTIGKLIMIERNELKMNQSDLAYEVQRSQDWLSLVERDKQEPTIDDLRNLAKVLHSTLLYDIAEGRNFLDIKRRW